MTMSTLLAGLLALALPILASGLCMRVAQLPSFSVSCSKLSGLRRAPGSREETTPFCLRLQNQTFVPFRDKKENMKFIEVYKSIQWRSIMRLSFFSLGREAPEW
ncbi:hypothetical protein C4D60_Mb05t14810 [Musa balbisiana]|uniref:Secreted protein n=1 Tax=Musa balbisiana TaxID=52838 RepID=A0A4S8JW80_MUSBA|nr:hypothetical protein C4D60_Mb05t14810 [Musa balbisiana]